MAGPTRDISRVSDQEIVDAFHGEPLAVFVSHSKSRVILEDLLEEASRLGIAFTVFFMDDGASLLSDHEWLEALPKGSYAACDLSARVRGIETPNRIVPGGQYQNAIMIHDASHVVSL